MARVRLIAGLAVTGLLLGCSAAPVTSPSGGPSGPIATTASSSSPSPNPPSPSPTPAGGRIGDHWVPIALGGPGAFALAGVHGDAGLVVVGRVCDETACEYTSGAAWTSSDGATWRNSQIPDVEDLALTRVDYNGRYVAVADRTAKGSDGIFRVAALLWRSSDGRSWEKYAEMKLGACAGTAAAGDELECPHSDQFTMTRGGLIVLRVDNPVKPSLAGTYLSHDGKSWARIDPADLGFRAADEATVTAVTKADLPSGGQVAVLAWVSKDDKTHVWATETGASWIDLGSINGTSVSFASDGHQILAAADFCATTCGTAIWSRVEGPFAQSAGPFPVTTPYLAFAGGSFLLAAMDHSRIRTFVSGDSVAWTEGAPDLVQDCNVGALVGGPATAILIGDDCGRAWLTRAVAP